MGGRGASSSAGLTGTNAGAATVIMGALNMALGNGGGVQNQAPNAQNTPVVQGAVTLLSQMSDSQLATLYNQSKRVDMPNHLNDVNNDVQKFVFAAGLNAKPQVLDQASFNQYLQDNNIPRSNILSRSVGGADYTVNGTRIRLSPAQVTALIRDGQLNYVGGKRGGALYGYGTYFDMNGGKNTGYANGATTIGVLSKTAKPITLNSLQTKTASWAKSHPQFARAVGSFTRDNASIYALAQGYNIITSGSGYYNVIDRSALVMLDHDI